jgi:hypothetical protein
MTITIESQTVLLTLLLIIIELAGVALFLWWRICRLLNEHDELAGEADMQGDALREALNELDRRRGAR